MPASPEDFKQVLSRWASGVSVVTTNDGGMLYGITVSSFSSVSMEPPLISVCLNRGNRLAEMVEHAGKFAVSILGADQQAASNYFAQPQRSPTEGFSEIEGDWVDLDLPVVKGSIAWLACTVHAVVTQGSHAIMIGHVEASGVGAGQSPLLYFNRGYRELQA